MNDNLPERFCSHCGVDLVPLQVPHTFGPCADCGRVRYFVRVGDGGKGIKIEAGESFTIPSGWMTMSLDPTKGRGRLFRGGVSFLLQQFMLTGMPGNQHELLEKLNSVSDRWEAELQQSDKLAGIDLSSPTGGDQAYERLKDEKESWEWHMLLKMIDLVMLKEAVEANDAKAAGFAGLLTGLFHGLTVLREPYFEETVWRGYQAGIAIHECGNAGDHVLGESEALAELDPVFQKLGEATLRTWLDSGTALGPRLGVTKIPEPMLVARAKWHVEELLRQRDAQARAPAERRAKSELRLKWFHLLFAIIGSFAFGNLLSHLGITLGG